MAVGRDIGVAVIGTGFMGGIHARAHNFVRQAFPDNAGYPVLKVVADVVEEGAKDAAFRYSFPRWTTNWRDVLDDPEVEVVDICAPPLMHAEMAIAAARAGKHVYCEKPVSRTIVDVEEIVSVIDQAGVQTFVGLNYPWCPALQYAQELIQSGRLGDLRVARVVFRADQDFAWSSVDWRWRMSSQHAGWGALGDLGSHCFDAARRLVGDVAELIGQTSISVPERRDPATGQMRVIDNDDSFQALVKWKNGATGTVEASRAATGDLARFEIEINGSQGAIFWDFRRFNELELFVYREDRRECGWTRVQMGPMHKDQGRFSPSAGHGIGYVEMKSIEIANFMNGIATGKQGSPSIHDYLKVARWLDAVPKQEWVRFD
jgi:predicted dehydrogenase